MISGTRPYARYALAFLLALATFLVYLPALRNGLVYFDDSRYILDVQQIRSLDWPFLKWAFTDTTTFVYWHPLTWISYAVDHRLWGLDPFGYHLTNNLLHAINTGVVVVLVVHLLEASRVHTDGIAPRLTSVL